MTCQTTCPCRCGQMGCGCHEAKPRPAVDLDVPAVSTGQTAICKCLRRVAAKTVTTPKGAKVEVLLCPICDRRRCRECGSYQQDPSSWSCAACGVKFE